MADKEYPTEEFPTEDKPQQQQGGDEHPTEDNAHAADTEAHEPIDENTSNDVKNEDSEPDNRKEKPTHKITPGVLIFLICAIIAFVFCLAGMSIGMFDSRTNSSCISIWGYKPKCLGSWFRHMDFDDWKGSGEPCNKADSLVQGAQAFSVMCIIGGLFTVAVGFLEALGYAELAVVAGIMSCINTAATLVTWSTMCAMYWSNLCGMGVYADDYKLGSGLILFISAWCLQMVGNAALIVDIYLGNAK